LIKASKGGGGKGMRVVYKANEFQDSLDAAKREAKNAFGDDSVLLEKFIEDPRHIEFQVLSDTHGKHLHLYERECSIQRRHQKIVEETPSVALDNSVREKMAQASISLTSGINYRGAGTIEYILDKNGEFFFLEMNTRLQVEHPITEMVTGVDLVKEQIAIAEGRALGLEQEQIKQRGHSIEVRIYAEDPQNDFLPSVGKIEFLGESSVKNVRMDTGYVSGNVVSINYDPMLAKLIVWGSDRNSAIEKCKLALNEVLFLGLKTNRSYLKKILEHQSFVDGETFTHFVQTHKEQLLTEKASSDEELAHVIAAYLLNRKGTKSEQSSSTVWDQISGFRNI
jgi:3-methylcrotonyl-CoA carboxylase alpha subunit